MAQINYDDVPKREQYDTDADYILAMHEWTEALRGPFPDRVVPEQDLYTGPDFDENLKNRDHVFPDKAVPNQDLVTGPGVTHSNYVNEGPGVK